MLLHCTILVFSTFAIAQPSQPDARSHFESGKQHYSKGDWDKAIAEYSEAIRLDPSFGRALIHRAVAKLQKADNTGAIDDCTAAIRLNPNEPWAFYNRGNARVALQQEEEAIKDLTEAIRLAPNTSVFFAVRGCAFAELGKNRDAISDCSEAIRLDPKSPVAFRSRGLAYLKMGEHEKCIDDSTEAIRLRPGYADAFYDRISAYQSARRFDDAMRDARKVVEKFPKDARAQFNLATTQVWQEDWKGAAESFDRALSLDARHAYAKAWKAMLLASCPDPKYRDGKKALKLAREVCEETKWKNQFAAESLAAAHAEVGEFSEAVEMQKKVLEDKKYVDYRGDVLKQALRHYETKRPNRLPGRLVID
jgi:tetratricopeptide (TPR) repeat protein